LHWKKIGHWVGDAHIIIISIIIIGSPHVYTHNKRATGLWAILWTFELRDKNRTTTPTAAADLYIAICECFVFGELYCTFVSEFVILYLLRLWSLLSNWAQR
jgi:hypothetical protein